VTSGAFRTASARLARAGFTEPERAAAALDAPLLAPLMADDEVVAALAATADPDDALRGLGRLMAVEQTPEALAAALRDDSLLRDGLFAVLGASPALAEQALNIPLMLVALDEYLGLRGESAKPAAGLIEGIPAKAVLRVADAMKEVKEAKSFGIKAGDVQFDFGGARWRRTLARLSSRLRREPGECSAHEPRPLTVMIRRFLSRRSRSRPARQPGPSRSRSPSDGAWTLPPPRFYPLHPRRKQPGW